MIALRNAPIKRKLMVVLLLTTSLALVLMGGAVMAYEALTFSSALTNNTSVLARVIGSISTSSLAFADQEDATEVLSVLSAEPQITAAAIYDSQGKLFAQYPSMAGLRAIPAEPGADGSAFGAAHLIMFQPIMEKNKRLGTIYLRADLSEMYSRLFAYGGLVLIACVGAIIGSLAVSTTLQRLITRPIGLLAKTARAVSERQDYSVRATQYGSDEIGELTDAFNQMLTRIDEASSALADSEERLRLALEGSETGTWDWNLATNQMTWDDYMFPLYGIQKTDWDGSPQGFFSLIHGDDRFEVERQFKQAIVSQKDIHVAFRICGPNEEIRHMASRGRVFQDLHGKPVRMSGVSMDVTQAKQTEVALQNAKNNAEAANRAKDEFLAILSHELRTPLSPVLATLALLEEDKTTPAALQPDLEMIRRNVEVEARIIDDLLDVTRIARGKLELHSQTVDLRPLLIHAVNNYLRDPAAAKGVRVNLENEPDFPWIHADAARITQVLWNLLQNACKFTPENGSITIRAYNEKPAADPAAQPHLVIQVTDTGIGIDPEILPRIFDAFEQGERSRTRRFGGLGLGLAISRAIIGMHGGTLTASSGGKDLGATFTIRLPTQAEPSTRSLLPPVKPDQQPAPQASTRILLVEDHEDSAQQMARLLRRAGHQVTCATTLAEGLEKGLAGGFDLLISDLGLPDGSGHELMEQLAARRPLPAIALSGYGMEEDIKKSLVAGFARHLTKPVNWPELKAAIQTLTQTDEV
ncbi:ATP-binding protein [Prosthecobacter sp. SYSU 5D2]|uniref:ATP-binding protein n=1 Tax=Prosthecobacter sp. SYSU 5D2 TaxID=3134134 RepID=UPI0031FEF5E4